jgi:hypothetical protein
MKRWYVARVLPPEAPLPPDATEEQIEGHRSWYRLAVTGAVPRYEAIIPTDPITGVPLFGWGLALVDAADFTAADADAANMIGLPRIGMDRPLSDVFTNTQLTNFRDRLLAHGVVPTGLTRNSTLRQVVRQIGAQLQADFDETRVRG